MATFRGALFLIFLFVFSTVYGVLAAPALLLGKGAARGAAQRWCRLVLFGLRAICGVRTRLEGAENLPQKNSPALVAANHQSMWETLALYALLPSPVIILKRELLRIPIFNIWLKGVGNIPIDRTAGPQALRQLIKDADAAFAEGAQIIIFPEGTRTPVGVRRRLQPGVAALYAGALLKNDAPAGSADGNISGVPCIPAVHDSGRHWLTPGPAKMPGPITLRILSAIPPGLDRKTFLRVLEADMLNARPDLPAAGENGMAAPSSAPDLTSPQGASPS